MKAFGSFFAKKQPEKIEKIEKELDEVKVMVDEATIKLTYSTDRPVDGKGNDRDVWIVYKEVE